jgi:ABC-type amino acid transport substrate-binding protein
MSARTRQSTNIIKVFFEKRPVSMLTVGFLLLSLGFVVYKPAIQTCLLIFFPLFLFLTIYSYKIDLLRVSNSQLKKSNKRMLGSKKFNRFENIEDVAYGHLKYSPLLYYIDDIPSGIGVEILKQIFVRNRILKYKYMSTWDNVINHLREGKFDIIATPIFETNQRTSEVSFSLPIYFANVGIYVKNGYLDKSLPKSLSFECAIDQLKMKAMRKELRLQSIEGELSDMMAKKLVEKHCLPAKSDTIDPSADNVSGLISKLEDDDSDVVFVESLIAEQHRLVRDGTVINILRDFELLYPVGFAMRLGDYVLRNYVNIKLLELDDKYPHGILEMIHLELRNTPDYKNLTMEDVKRHFIREKPIPI